MDKAFSPNPTPGRKGTGNYQCPPSPEYPQVSPDSNNLIQNPSFERGLADWITDNVDVTDGSPFEGTQVARMSAGVASMFQDVSLIDTGLTPLFLSFYIEGTSFNDGNLIVELLWLDNAFNQIGIGLRQFIPPSLRIPTRVSFFAVTDQPPEGTAWARLQFSKGQGAVAAEDFIKIDQVILTPVNSGNLVQNPGFELGLTGWTATGFTPNFTEAFTGLGQAAGEVSGGTLFQDIPLTHLPANTPLLVSFAVRSLQTSNGELTVQVLWLNAAGDPIGPPGLNVFIPHDTLDQQINYFTYLALTPPAPFNAVTARIVFTTLEPTVFVDQVILTAAKTTNLIQNPGFEAGLDHWSAVNWTAEISDFAYEGTMVARGANNGGVIFQEVALDNAVGQCFLFNYAISNQRADLLAEIIWLDSQNREIGKGLNLIAPAVERESNVWVTYTGITEPAPSGTVKARVQFTKGQSGIPLDLDKVILGRLGNSKPVQG